LPHITPTGAKEWGAVLPQYAGLLVLIFSAVFWALTGRLEPALLGAGTTLLVGGQGAEALQALKRPPPPPPLPNGNHA
jgi:hypothetical protein